MFYGVYFGDSYKPIISFVLLQIILLIVMIILIKIITYKQCLKTPSYNLFIDTPNVSLHTLHSV